MNRSGLKRDDRIEITGIMLRDPSGAPEPDPIPVGTTGTVVAVLNPGSDLEQIAVNWDADRSLLLLPEDPYRVLPPQA